MPSLSCVLRFFSRVSQRVVTSTGFTFSVFSLSSHGKHLLGNALGKAMKWHMTISEMRQGFNCNNKVFLGNHVQLNTLEMEMRVFHFQSLPSAEGIFSWPWYIVSLKAVTLSRLECGLLVHLLFCIRYVQLAHLFRSITPMPTNKIFPYLKVYGQIFKNMQQNGFTKLQLLFY